MYSIAVGKEENSYLPEVMKSVRDAEKILNKLKENTSSSESRKKLKHLESYLKNLEKRMVELTEITEYDQKMASMDNNIRILTRLIVEEMQNFIYNESMYLVHMESILKQSGDDIDVVYCENDNEAFGAIDAIEAAGYEVGGEEGQILVMSFDTTNAGLTETLAGKISLNTECNPLHGPRVEEIIQKLEAGEEVEKQAYVDEVAFSSDDTVTSVTIEDQDYEITPITQEIIDGRAY